MVERLQPARKRPIVTRRRAARRPDDSPPGDSLNHLMRQLQHGDRPDQHPEMIPQLQHTIGNQGVMRLLQRTPAATIQRLPTAVEFQTEAGTAKKNMESYGKVLTALRNLDDRLTLSIGAESIKNAYALILECYDRVYRAADDYVTKKEGKFLSSKRRIAAMKNLRTRIMRERVVLGTVYDHYLRQPKQEQQRVTWKQALTTAATGDAWRNQAVSFSDDDVQSTARGGSHEVKKLTPGGKGPAGYFQGESGMTANPDMVRSEIATAEKKAREEALKQGDDLNVATTKGVIAQAKRLVELLRGTPMDPGNINVEEMQQRDELRGWLSGILNTLTNMDYVMVTGAGIGELPNTPIGQDDNLNLPQRNVAMTRLDRLLGAGVIARAEKAVSNTGEKGSLMEATDGTQATSLSKPQVNKLLTDPNFMRQLSRLQLLDTIAFQVDRNLSNYFVRMDRNGKVIGLTGIDNDMSFGKSTDIGGREGQYPGLSRYVDSELAEAILNMQPSDLDYILSDLVSPGEITAARSRLEMLQMHLQQLKQAGKLLKPDEWTLLVQQGLLNEKGEKGENSYYRMMQYEMSKRN